MTSCTENGWKLERNLAPCFGDHGLPTIYAECFLSSEPVTILGMLTSALEGVMESYPNPGLHETFLKVDPDYMAKIVAFHVARKSQAAAHVQ